MSEPHQINPELIWADPGHPLTVGDITPFLRALEMPDADLADALGIPVDSVTLLLNTRGGEPNRVPVGLPLVSALHTLLYTGRLQGDPRMVVLFPLFCERLGRRVSTVSPSEEISEVGGEAT